MRKNIIIIVSIVLALILGRMFLSHLDKMKSAKMTMAMRTPSVTVAPVETQDVVRQFDATARVVAKYRVDVLARISGYLTKSYFKEGDFVKAGQVLFEIEPQQYQYAASQAKANLNNARSMSDYYNKQLARYRELVDQDYVARSEYDNILAQREAYTAQMDSADSAYRDAQRNLGYTRVKSPVDGRVGIIEVTVGNYVTSASGPLTTINSSEPMYVTFPLDSKDFAELARIDKSANVNRTVDFIFSSGEKYELQGIQDFHDNKIDETTGTITMRATFKNPEGKLIQGDFGRVIIYSNSKDALPVVPQSAAMENQEGRFVYILDEDDLPRMVYITTMGQTEDNQWIVSSGLKAGDRLVTSGLQKVTPGSPVNIVKQAVTEDGSQAQKIGFWTKVMNKIKGLFRQK
jgi:membrane fusion protein (multidrug efflux system)